MHSQQPFTIFDENQIQINRRKPPEQKGRDQTYTRSMVAFEPDKLNQTVKGVAGAILGLMLNGHSSSEPYTPVSHNDPQIPSIFSSLSLPNSPTSHSDPPTITFADVYNLIFDLFRRTRMEPEALIAGLLYVQQIIAVLEWPALPFQCWRRVVFACLMIASKMWDDHSCSTRSFGRCSHGKLATTTLVEIERTILLLLDYRLFLTDTDYANTYYQLKGIWMNLQLDTEGNVLPHPVSLLPELSLPRNWHPCALFRMESPSIGTPVPNNPSYDSASGIGEFGIRSSDPTDNVHIPPSPVTVVSTPVREIVEQSELIVKRPEIVNGEKRGRHWREDKSELKPILYTYPTQSLSFGVHDAAGIGRHGETYDRVPTAEILYSTAHPTTQRIKQRQ